MTFRQLEYIEAIAVEGSISEAAKKLFISQSALSQQIIKIEEEYQLRILDRDKSPLQLTPDGQIYLQSAQEILRIKRQLELELQHRRQHRLCIKTVPFYAANLLPYLLARLRREASEIEVSLKVDWAPQLFRTSYHEHVDLYVHAFDMTPWSPGTPPSDTTIQEVLLQERILVAMSAMHPVLPRLNVRRDDQGWPCVDLKELRGETILLPTTSTRLISIARLLFQNAGLEERFLFCETGFDDMLGQLQYSNHLAFFPDTTARFCSSAAEIRFFRLEGKEIIRPVVAAYLRGMELSAPARQFIQVAKRIGMDQSVY